MKEVMNINITLTEVANGYIFHVKDNYNKSKDREFICKQDVRATLQAFAQVILDEFIQK